MSARGYVHADTHADVELERLRLLEARYDAATARRLNEWGDLVGARCLEVGAGAGSVARLLGEAVGPGGSVLAVDSDPRFLTESQGPNVVVQRHDILDGPVPDVGAFDLAHARALLLHLPDPLRALRNVVASLRPGGRVLLEDADFATMVAADPIHPASATFDRVLAATLSVQRQVGTFDAAFGRTLLPLARRAGLVDCRQEATAALRWGGSTEALLLRVSCERPSRVAREADLVAEADLRIWTQALADPEFCFYDALSVAVWGQLPHGTSDT